MGYLAAIVYLLLTMVFTDEDKPVIKFLKQNKCNGAKRFLSEFLKKRETLSGLKQLLNKIDTSRATELDQRVIDAAMGQRRTRLPACVKAKDGHFEHKLR